MHWTRSRCDGRNRPADPRADGRGNRAIEPRTGCDSTATARRQHTPASRHLGETEDTVARGAPRRNTESAISNRASSQSVADIAGKRQHLPLREIAQRANPRVTPISRKQESTPGRTRTCDLRFRKALLYPPELRGRRQASDVDPTRRCSDRNPNHLSSIITRKVPDAKRGGFNCRPISHLPNPETSPQSASENPAMDERIRRYQRIVGMGSYSR